MSLDVYPLKGLVTPSSERVVSGIKTSTVEGGPPVIVVDSDDDYLEVTAVHHLFGASAFDLETFCSEHAEDEFAMYWNGSWHCMRIAIDCTKKPIPGNTRWEVSVGLVESRSLTELELEELV